MTVLVVFITGFSGYFVHLNFTYVINVVHCDDLFGFIHVGLGARLVRSSGSFISCPLCVEVSVKLVRVLFGIVTAFWSTSC